MPFCRTQTDKSAQFYMSMPEKSSITIDKTFKPPPQLQINSASRISSSTKFYSASTTVNFTHLHVLLAWIKSLTLDAFQSISSFQHSDHAQKSISTGGTSYQDEKKELHDLDLALDMMHLVCTTLRRMSHPEDIEELLAIKTRPLSKPKRVGKGLCKVRWEFVKTDFKTGEIVGVWREDNEIRHRYRELCSRWRM